MKKSAEVMLIEKETGARFLGQFDTEVMVPLTDGDRIELSIAQSKALEAAKSLESELKKTTKEFKNKIEAFIMTVYEMARIVNKGEKQITKNLPCFYSPRERARIFVDLSTGEVVSRKDPQLNDAQMNLEDVSFSNVRPISDNLQDVQMSE